MNNKPHGLASTTRETLGQWYATNAETTIRYPDADSMDALYPRYGLLEELGEVAGVLAKGERDGIDTKPRLTKEIGDVFWMLRALTYSLDEDLFANIIDRIVVELDEQNYASGGEPSNYPMMHGLTVGAVNLLEGYQTIEAKAGGLYLFYGELHAFIGMLSVFTLEQGITVTEVLETNIEKLRARLENNTIHGQGDDR